MSQPTFEVQLAVYDLSHGMARGLSAQLLGPDHAIDVVPHTGIVVYGLEYFFGGGIQAADPMQFRQSRQMHPIEVQSLGHTSVSKEEFEAWCQSVVRAGEYNAMAYDLLTKNCNNFAHDAALRGLKLSKGVPDWILEVPQRFLASPMGQMMRPMLEQMQLTGDASSAPFATESTARPIVANTMATPSVSAESNPWANIPSTSGSSSDEAAKSKAVPTPVLDAHNRPLLSNDTNVAEACVRKLTTSLEDDAETALLQELSQNLTKGAKPQEKVVEDSCRLLLKMVKRGGSDVVFALMLLRLVVLHPPASADMKRTAFTQCIEWVSHKVRQDRVLSVSAKAIAWCTLSNAYTTLPSSVSPLGDVVEAAMTDLNPESQSRSEVRQSAAAFLYNVSQAQSPLADRKSQELPDLLVSLLCGSLDGIEAEPDETTRLRRLLVAARIVKPERDELAVNEAAKSLIADLGFTESIASLANKDAKKGTNAGKVKELADELRRLVEN